MMGDEIIYPFLTSDLQRPTEQMTISAIWIVTFYFIFLLSCFSAPQIVTLYLFIMLLVKPIIYFVKVVLKQLL